MTFTRIYLDQMAWIQLTQARLSQPRGKRYEDAYLFAREAVRRGEASFVLSLTHQYETQRRSRWDSRIEVVETMVELSRFHGIAHPKAVVHQEIDNVILQWLGLESAPVRVFGIGLNFMLGGEVKSFTLPEQLDIEQLGYPPSFARLVHMHSDRAWELILMAGPHPDAGPQYRAFFNVLQQIDKRFSDGQHEVARLIKDLGVRRHLDDAMVGYALSEIKNDIFQRAARRGVSPSQVLDVLQGRQENFRALLESIPSRHVVKEMSLMQHAQPQKGWKPNDLSDFTALGVAVPYCDAVITEKFWTDVIRRRHLDNRYETMVSSTLEDLPRMLLELG